MNYSVIVIPAFLSKIPALQVFLGVAGSYIGSLKSYVGTFCTHIKLWYPLSELRIWCFRNARFISLRCSSTLWEKSLGWILWISAPHIGSVSPCFGLSTLSNILRIALAGSCSLSCVHCTGYTWGDSPPSYATCVGCLIRGDTTALAELIRATVVANVHSEARHVKCALFCTCNSATSGSQHSLR